MDTLHDAIRATVDVDLAAQLDVLNEDGLLRALRALPSTGGKFTWNSREILNFSSNDYLNLASHPRLKTAAHDAIERYGCGAGASRLMSGNLEIHEALEARLAGFVNQPAALLFATGYQANVGVITALAGEGDTLYSDRLNHASIIDGSRLARARVEIYDHCDMNDLEQRLRRNAGKGRRVIVSDSIFSMDGDLAPVRDLADLAERYDAALIIDEAHAIGVYGKGGGLCKDQGVAPDVTVGTLSKALGSSGGFAACSPTVREWLINRARPFIFSTALAPACAAAALAALDVLRETPGLGEQLLKNARRFTSDLDALLPQRIASSSQIVPLLVGENRAALDLARALVDNDILATAIRPPSVPAGTARLRLAVTLAHSEEDLARVTQTLAAIAQRGPAE